MTQREKEVLLEIVTVLEKVSKAVLDLQDKANIHAMVQLPRKLDTLRSQIDALPSA